MPLPTSRLSRAYQALLNHTDSELDTIAGNLKDTSHSYILHVLQNIVGEPLTIPEGCAALHAWMIDSHRIDPANVRQEYSVRAFFRMLRRNDSRGYLFATMTSIRPANW